MITIHSIGKKLIIACLALAAICVQPRAVHASEAALLEYQVKAAFLYNFCKFVEWPAEAFSSPDAPLMLVVVGTDPFGPSLDEVLTGKAVGSHKLLITRMPTIPADGTGLKQAHMVFIGCETDEDIASTLSLLTGTHALTVGDRPDFAQKGGAIGFTLVQDKVRFQINLNPIRKAGLVMSSQLIKLATDVVQPTNP